MKAALKWYRPRPYRKNKGLLFLVLLTMLKYHIHIYLGLTCLSGTPFHGREVTRGPYGVWKQAAYVCNPGYIMVGDSVRNCVDKGNGKADWNEDLPRCLTHDQYQNYCNLQKQKVVQRNGKYSCGKVCLQQDFSFMDLFVSDCKVV